MNFFKLFFVSCLGVLVSGCSVKAEPPEISLRPEARPERSIIRPMARPENLGNLPDVVFDEDQQRCLALNIYYESRGEPLEGQEAIAWVTLNRVLDDSFPDTICGVVSQPNQFSWYNRHSNPSDQESWRRSKVIATYVVYNYDIDDDVTEGATYFHSTSVNPYWTKSFEKTVNIGNHTFYRT